MKKKMLLLLLSLIAIVLELLPYGAVLNFAADAGETIRSTFSYFSLTPFGYANFGPFLTALISVAVVIGCILYAVKEWRFAMHLLREGAAIGVLTSLMPLMFGVSYLTVCGIGITLCLAAVFAVALWMKE